MDRLTANMLLECMHDSSCDESVLTEPVSVSGSEDEDDDMMPLRLVDPENDLDGSHHQQQEEQQLLQARRPRRPLQDLTRTAPLSTVARLALRVQEACAAAGERVGVNPLRQLQVQQQQQQQVPAVPKVKLPAQYAHDHHYDDTLADENQENIPVDPAGRPLRYCCKTCPARFTHINLLTRHTNEQHPVPKPFPCPGCGRGYVSRDVMESHFLMVHQGERPYPCDQCDKVFSRREYLVTHGRVHTGVRPYACPMAECGRRFAWRGAYDYHIRTHTGERPYVCLYCFKDFRDNGTRKLHEMIHTNSFPYSCNRCERKFRRSYKLREHAVDHEKDDAEGQHPAGEDRGLIPDCVVSRAEEEAAVAAVTAALAPAPQPQAV